MKFLKLFLLTIIGALLTSCNSNERALKKFESRLNAEEYACASVYI